MPGKDRLEKRKEQYRKLYEKLGNIKSRDPYATEKEQVRNAFGSLNGMIESLSVKQQGAFKKLSSKEVEEMTSLYENTMKSLNELNEKMAKQYRQIMGNAEDIDDLSSGQKKSLKNLKAEMDFYDLVTNTVGKDIRSFYKASKKPESCDIHEIYEDSRTYAGYRVEEGQQFTKDAGNQNARLALTMIDEQGNKIKGYFSEDNAGTIAEEAEQKAKYAENKKRFGVNANFLSYDKLEELFGKVVDDNLYSSLLRGEIIDMGYEKGMKLLEEGAKKNDFDGLRNVVDSPKKFRVFAEMLQDYTAISNKHGITAGIGLSEKGRLNRRNAAMSNMAKLLGCEDVIAKSENVKLKLDGREVKGTFMKNAEGSDIHKIDLDSEMLALTPRSMEHLHLKKQLANLQVLDYLCGNPDRHLGNMMYVCDKDKDGNMQLKGIQGIDNDSAFGAKDYSKVGMSSIKPENMKVITKSMADKLLSMNKETLVNMFYGYEIDGIEIDNMTKRLETLQKKLKADDKVYAQGYGKGTLIEDRIKIVDDEELAMIRLDVGLSTFKNSKNMNYFARIKNVSDGYKNIDYAAKNIIAGVNKAVKNFTSGTLLGLTEIMDNIGNDDKRLQTGSSAYTKMRGSTKKVLEDLRAFGGQSFKKVGDDYVVSDGLKAISSRIEEAIKDCEAYQTYKHERNVREGKQDIDPRPHKLTRAERRWQNVEKNLAFLKKQQALFKKIEEQYVKVNEADRRIKTLKPALQKKSDEVTNEVYEERTRHNDKLKYENYKSRSKYVINEEAMLLKEAKQHNDPVALAKHRLDYNIKLGYALKVMKPEDRAAFRQSVEEMTGMKSKLSDEELFKRGVASKMISEKVRLLSKQNKGSLTKQEEKLLADLKGVVINPDSNGYDDLMKDETFNRFFEKESQKFDINSPIYEEMRPMLGGMQVTDIFRAGMAYAGLEEESAQERRFQFKNVAGEFAKEVEAAAKDGNAPLEKEENKVKEEQADITMQLV